MEKAKNGPIKGPGMSTSPLSKIPRKGILETQNMCSSFQHQTLRNNRNSLRAARTLLDQAINNDDLLQAPPEQLSACNRGSLMTAVNNYGQDRFVTLAKRCTSYGVLIHVMGSHPEKAVHVVVKWKANRRVCNLDDVGTWLNGVVSGGLHE